LLVLQEWKGLELKKWAHDFFVNATTHKRVTIEGDPNDATTNGLKELFRPLECSAFQCPIAISDLTAP
jgi:hypothetical protein